ncbi:MAG: hypothetical protein GXP02_07390 [Alphaproteobacteria bacterium]|nr:hypothetical protein [Alphaproteobacteria bacterium]
MSLGLAHRKELQRRRSQRFWLLIRIIFFLSIVIGSSYFAFDTGQKIALRNMTYNNDKFDQQTAELDQMRIALGNSRAALNELQRLLPNREIRNLVIEINRKAATGVTPKRMATLIAGLSKEARCSGTSQTKRFIVATPVSPQPEGTVSFYRGLITVTGNGSPALDESGNPEAWYDPSKPLTAIFTLPGGQAQRISGILPLHYSITLKDKAYRFTIIAGKRSFADITVQSCDL